MYLLAANDTSYKRWIDLSQRLQTAVQIMSQPPSPSNGGPNQGRRKWGARIKGDLPQYEKWEDKRMFSHPTTPIIALKYIKL